LLYYFSNEINYFIERQYYFAQNVIRIIPSKRKDAIMRETKKKNRYSGLDVNNWKVVNNQGVILTSSEVNENGKLYTKTLKGFGGFKAASFYALKVGGVAIRE
jgi:hypothetical protein